MATLGPSHYSPYPVAIYENVLPPPPGKALLFNEVVDEEVAMREAKILPYSRDLRSYMRGTRRRRRKQNS